MDRSDRPPRAPRETPKSAADEQAEFIAAKVARLGADVTCATCFHCYQLRLQPLDRAMQWVCYEGPPEHVLQPNGALLHLPRLVGPTFFCHRWKTLN